MRRLVVLLTGLLAACPPVPEDGRYRCRTRDDCGAGLACVEGVCAPCEPRTCAADPGACGRFDDGCGAIVDCACVLPDTCGGGGTPGRCGCSFAASCAALYPRCGEEAFACTASCGCPLGERCEEGRCAPCVPETCEARGLGCGRGTDGCGGRLDCGPCEVTERCQHDGEGSRCVRLDACLAEDLECGAASDGTQCGICELGDACVGGRCRARPECVGACGLAFTASGPLHCGGCAAGEACVRGACVSVERPFCFGAPTAWLEDRFEAVGLISSTVVPEHRGLRAWVATDAWYNSGRDTVCSRVFSLTLSEHGRVSSGPPTAFAPFSDFPELTPGVDCWTQAGAKCGGWISHPLVRRDGKEAFLLSNQPCGDWWDNEAYILVRTNEGEWVRSDWLSALSARGVVRPGNEEDGIESIVLLPDDRTLIVVPLAHAELRVWRRPSTVPGDARFVRIGTIPLAEVDPSGTNHERFSVSCDQRHLLYIVRDGTLQRPRQVEILSLDPLRLGLGQPYPGIRQAAIFNLSEADGCVGIYTSEANGEVGRSYYWPRVPCPP